MFTSFITIFIFALITLFGYFVVNIIQGRNLQFLEKLALGFLVGIGFHTLVLFILNIFGYKFSPGNAFFVLTMEVVFAIFLNLLSSKFRVNGNKKNTKLDDKLDLLEKLGFSLLAILFMSSLAHNLYWPIADWDALTLYDFRARVFAETGFMDQVLSIHRYYLGYPLFTSITHTVVYLYGSTNAHFVYSLFYGSFILLFFKRLSVVVQRKKALFFALALALTGEIYSHSTLAYTNLPYTIYYSLGLIYLFSWLRTKSIGDLITSALLVGLSSWVRSSEPFWVAPVIVVALVTFVERSWGKGLFYALAVLGFKAPWNAFLRSFYPDTTSSWVVQQKVDLYLLFYRFIEVATYVAKNVIKKEMLLYAMFALSLFLIKKKEKSTKIFASIIILNMLIVFGGIYVYSFVYAKWVLVGDSVSRMSMIFIPLVIFFLALFFNDENPAKARSKKK